MSTPVITLTSSSQTIKSSREASFSTEDREIDVFDADKYFNEGTKHCPNVGTENLSSHQHKKDDPIEIFAIKERPSISLPTIRSESSWNSRSALLHTVSKNQQPRKGKNKKSFLPSIGCNCCKSTDIDDSKGENTGLVNGKSRKGDKTVSENQAAKMLLQEKDGAGKRKTLENRNNCFTWDAVPPAEEIKIPSISSEMHNDNESDSDASSDLFEIESLTKGNPFLSRQASDGCRTPTTCYAPSEASIEWSVATASAADFSAISDSEEVISIITTPCPKIVGINPNIGAFKEVPKLRPAILSGCKNHKAVSVAGDAHRQTKPPSSDAKSTQESFDARLLYTW